MNDPIIDIPIRNIHLPDAIGWWPPALGWWLVFCTILLSLFCMLIYRLIRNRNRFKRSAQAELNRVLADHQQVMDPIVYVQNLSVYLRQTAMHFYLREQVASLTGNQWLQFLDATKNPTHNKAQNNNQSAQIETNFQSDAGKLLLTTPYDPNRAIDASYVEQLTALVQAWVAALPVVSRNAIGRVEK